MVGLAAAAVLLSCGDAHAQLPDPVNLLTYEIRTTWRGPDGDVTRSAPGLLFAAVPVDADGDVATGIAGADVLVQLSIDAGRAGLRVTRLPGAPDPLPLAVEVVLADPRGTSDLRVAFGYDTLDDDAPEVYDATVTLVGSSRVSSFTLDVHTTGPGDSLAVTAQVFKQGPGDTRIDPQSGRIAFSPVPLASHIGIVQGSDLGLQQSAIDLVTDTPTRVHATITDDQASRSVRGEAVIDRLPNTLSLLLTQASGGATTWNYRAGGRVERLDLSVVEQLAGTVRDEFAVGIDDMARSAVLVQESPEVATFQADSRIGALSVGFASRRAIEWLDDPAYLHLVDDGTADSLAVRILGLRSARIETGSDVSVDVDITPGPFRILVRQDPRTIEGWIRDLPGRVAARWSPETGRIELEGSAPIDEVTIDATDPRGIAGRATSLGMRLTGLPATVALTYDSDGATAALDATPGRIGSVEIDATDSTPAVVEDGFDGVVFVDSPDRYAFAVRLTGLRRAAVSASEAPYRLELDKDPGPFLVRLDEGDASARIEVHDLPSSLVATLDPAGSLSVSGSAPIGLITAELVDPSGVSGRATRASARLEDVPAHMEVSWEPSTGTMSAGTNGQPLGRLEILLTSGPEATLPAHLDGIVIRDLTDSYVVFARLTGLQWITAGQEPPLLNLQTTGGRQFQLEMDRSKPLGTSTVRALIENLPHNVTLGFDSPTTLAYTATSPVSTLQISASDPHGITGRATNLSATLRDIPLKLDVAWEPDGAITMDAFGGTLGSLDILLTSGPVEALPAGMDGILLRDRTDRYVIAARITGLRRASVTQSPQPDVLLETTGNRILRVDLEEQKSKLEYTRATLDRLPASVRIRVADTPSAQELFYTASDRTNSLVLDTNSGDRWNLNASLSNPLPASVSLCTSSNGYCTGFKRSSGAGALRFAASEHTTLNVFDCIRPLSSSCSRTGSPTEFTRVDNWRIRFLEQDADASGSGESGYIYMNTTQGGVRHNLSGYLLNRNSDGGGFEANFPSGFWADNRRGSWSGWGLFKTKTGAISCPGGTSLSVRVIGIWIGVTSYLC